MTHPIISIVLGSYNRRSFLKATIESVRRNGITIPYEIIVIDGGSTDGSVRWLTKQKDVITIVQHNRGTFRGEPIDRKSWGYFMNIAFKAAHGKYILMISDDCLLVPGSVMNGYVEFEDLLRQGRKIGAMPFYYRDWPENRHYHVGKVYGRYLHLNHGIYLRSALESVGWIDEVNYQFYHADTDLCLRLMENGLETVDCKTAFVEHFSHANLIVRSGNEKRELKDRAYFIKRWNHLQPVESRENVSRGLQSDYVDPHKTYRHFPKSSYPAFLLGYCKGTAYALIRRAILTWTPGLAVRIRSRRQNG